MREFSKVSTTLHGSRKFSSLGRDYIAKYVYQYILANSHVNSAGCYDLKDGYACEDMDMDIIPYRNAIDTLCKASLIEFDKDTKTVFICQCLDHWSPSNAKMAAGMLSQLQKASSDSLFCKRYEELITVIKEKKFDRDVAVRNANDTVWKRYQECIPTRPDQTETGDQTQTTDQTETILDLDLREKAQKAESPPATLSGGGHPPSSDDPVELYEKLERLSAFAKPSSSRLLSTPLMQRNKQ
jgi:hypothetical protein